MDAEKVIKALEDFNKNRICLPHLIPWDEIADALAMLKGQEYKDRMFHALEDDWKAMLKEQEAVKPRVSSVEQRCGNCNKVIEMDGWKACPWCGKMIDWERR